MLSPVPNYSENGHDALVQAVLQTPVPLDGPIANAAIYHRMVHANLSTVIANALPVTVSILDEDAMSELIEHFLADGGPETPLYRDVPGDFVAWATRDGHAYADLMGYEWLELIAARHPADADDMPPLSDPELVRLNPTIQVGVYSRAVHQLRPEQVEVEQFGVPKAYLVWRRPLTDEVCFHRVGLVLAQTLGVASAEPTDIPSMVRTTINQLPAVDSRQLTAALIDLVALMRCKEGVL